MVGQYASIPRQILVTVVLGALGEYIVSSQRDQCESPYFYHPENATCALECPLFYIGDTDTRNCTPFTSNYIASSNATSFYVSFDAVNESGVVQIPFSVTVQLSALSTLLFPALSMNVVPEASSGVWGFSDGSRFRQYTNDSIRLINDKVLGPAIFIQDRLFLAYTINLTTVADDITHSSHVDLMVGENATGIRVAEAIVNIIISPVDCGPPLNPVDGSLDQLDSHTTVGASITFQCSQGFTPSSVVTAFCTFQGWWHPAPEDHSCMAIEASVNLTALDRVPSTPNMECENDIISYNCSIFSNSEDLHLWWYITQPNFGRMASRYNSTSSIPTVRTLGNNVTTVLTSFDASSGRVESTIHLPIRRGVIASGTSLMCGIQLYGDVFELETDDVVVAEPLEPTGLRISERHYQDGDIIATLMWDPPQGSGQEAVVNLFNIYISPPLSPAVESPLTASSFPLNVTLQRNVVYNISIAAENCAGQSTELVLPNVLIIDCGPPSFPANNLPGTYSSTAPGANVTVRCKIGYTPSSQRMVSCDNTGRWMPSPETLTCEAENESGIRNYLPYFVGAIGLIVVLVTMLSFVIFLPYMLSCGSLTTPTEQQSRIQSRVSHWSANSIQTLRA